MHTKPPWGEAAPESRGYGLSFSAILSSRASLTPDRRAFVHLDRHGREADGLTFAELDRRVDAIASEMLAHDLTGRNVVLIYPPGLEFIAALFACFRVQATAVPVPFTAGRRTEHRVVAICRDARPAAIASLSTFAAAHEIRALLSANAISPPWLDTDRCAAASAPLVLPAANPDAIALLQYTSGSTGTPKGVMLSHRNLLANNAMIAAAFGHDETLRGVGWLPLFHDMGLIGHVLQPVYVGGLSVIMSPFTFLQRPQRWLEAISEWRATTSGSPSHGFALCLRSIREDLPASIDLASWKVAYCGAETVRPEVLTAFADRYSPHGFDPAALRPCYGLAEASLLVTSIGAEGPPFAKSLPRPSAAGQGVNCGRAWRGGEVAIADPDRGTPCAEGEVGEIIVTGPHVGHGYWRRPEESAAIFATQAGTSDRSLRTGDLGYLRGGDLHVVGRIKDTIIIFGVKHAAEDLEQTVANSDAVFAKHPCAVFGMDSAGTEHAVAVQEIDPASLARGDLTGARERAAAAIVAEHGVKLHEFLLVKPGALPRTTSGKLQRAQARRHYAEGRFARLDPPSTPGAGSIAGV